MISYGTQVTNSNKNFQHQKFHTVWSKTFHSYIWKIESREMLKSLCFHNWLYFYEIIKTIAIPIIWWSLQYKAWMLCLAQRLHPRSLYFIWINLVITGSETFYNGQIIDNFHPPLWSHVGWSPNLRNCCLDQSCIAAVLQVSTATGAAKVLPIQRDRCGDYKDLGSWEKAMVL